MSKTEKPRATEQDIEIILNHYGKDKDFLKECWKVCAKNNLILPYKLYFDLDEEYYTYSDSCKELKKDGVKWKWLPNDILQIIPSMAAPYMELSLDRDISTPSETEETILTDGDLNADITNEIPNLDEEEQIVEFPNEMTDEENKVFDEVNIPKRIIWQEEIINKLENNQHISEKDLKELVFDGYSVRTDYGENRRWSRTVEDIIMLTDRNDNKYFYSLLWEEGLTEMQENEFYSQPERVYPYEKITVDKQELFTHDKLIADSFNENTVDLNFVKGVLEDSGMNLDLNTGNLSSILNEEEVVLEENNSTDDIEELEEQEYDPFDLDF